MTVHSRTFVRARPAKNKRIAVGENLRFVDRDRAENRQAVAHGDARTGCERSGCEHDTAFLEADHVLQMPFEIALDEIGMTKAPPDHDEEPLVEHLARQRLDQRFELYRHNQLQILGSLQVSVSLV